MKTRILILSCFLIANLITNESHAQDKFEKRTGTSYSVISTNYVYEPCSVWCGYNDLSIPNMAKYKVEVLKYEEYYEGKLVRSWAETRKTFVECHNP